MNYRTEKANHDAPPWRMLAFVCFAVLLCGFPSCERPSWLGGMQDEQGTGNGEGDAGEEKPEPKPDAGDTIAAIGSHFVTYGCWALGIAVLARVATFVFAIARPFAGIIDDCIILAGSAVAFGAALAWVGLNSWVLWVVCLACLAGWIAYRRKSIIALWRKIVKGKQ